MISSVAVGPAVLLLGLMAAFLRTTRTCSAARLILRIIPPSKTYVVALQTMVFAQAGDGQDRERIQRNVDWLVKTKGVNGWSYGGEKTGLPDNSNTQYALLGLHEGIVAGGARRQAGVSRLSGRAARTGGDQGERPLAGDLQPLRRRLCPGKARLDRLLGP